MLGELIASMYAMIDGHPGASSVHKTFQFLFHRYPSPLLYDSWAANKAYAAYLNWHRPRGRKLSWKKLNRKQRAEAMDWYDEMIRVGGVARSYYEPI